MTNNHEHWERELQQGLERMDSWVTPQFVDTHMWQQLIVHERRAQRKRLMRELTFFWMIAIAVLSLGFISFAQLPLVFVVVQGVVLLGFSLYGFLGAGKKVWFR